MDIVFNVNKLGLEGLGATLTSLIRNCSNSSELILWFLISGLDNEDKANINLLLENESYSGAVKFYEFDAKKEFGNLKSLHGDWTAYGRLLIPRIVNNDKALYLDSDLIILLDILTLKNHVFSNTVLGAVFGSSVEYALERDFFINQLKFDPSTDYFNSGVLLFNIKKWRDDGYDKLVEEIGRKYSDNFQSADQTLLNILCAGNFSRLNSMYNVAWYPGSDKPDQEGKAIIHFVGSPKPWDFFAKSIHKGHTLWKSYNTPFWSKKYSGVTVDKLQRFWNLRRSYIRWVKNKVK